MTTAATKGLNGTWARLRLGFMGLFRGLGLLREHRRLRVWAAMPFLITVCIMVWGFYLAAHYLPLAVNSMMLMMSAWTGLYFSMLYYVFLVLLWPLFILAWMYLMFLMVKLVASPFHALLAEHVLIEQKVLAPRRLGIANRLLVAARMLIISLGELAVFTVLGLTLFLFSLVPGLNIVTSFLFFLIVAFDCSDYAFEALRMGFAERFRFFKQHGWEFSGFALGLSVMFLIPGLNLLLFPAAVVGAADLVRRIQSKQLT